MTRMPLGGLAFEIAPCRGIGTFVCRRRRTACLLVSAAASRTPDVPDPGDLLDTPLAERVECDVSLASGIAESILGAPAVTVGVTAPRPNDMNLNLRANCVGRRTPYTRSPLRNQGRALGPCILIHAARRDRGPCSATWRVPSIFDNDHAHPGVEHVDSGDDLTTRSHGFRDSVIPRPGPTVALSGTLEL